MRDRSLGMLLAAAVVVATGACAPPPTPSPSLAGACSDDLPPRTSPTDYPVAVLSFAGNDVPPVIRDVEWLGDDEPVATSDQRPVHLERFTVVQAQGQSEISLRMTDGVEIESWTVDAFPNGTFRVGDEETGRMTWSEGTGPTDLVCVPIADGEWAISAQLTFADGAGGGTFYWRINVAGAPAG
jgi:hypothetical protein